MPWPPLRPCLKDSEYCKEAPDNFPVRDERYSWTNLATATLPYLPPVDLSSGIDVNLTLPSDELSSRISAAMQALRTPKCCWNRKIQPCDSSDQCDFGGEGCIITGTRTKKFGVVTCQIPGDLTAGREVDRPPPDQSDPCPIQFWGGPKDTPDSPSLTLSDEEVLNRTSDAHADGSNRPYVSFIISARDAAYAGARIEL